MAKLSPMMKLYLEKKADYPDCIMFYRLGDFYEMFFEDARLASRELSITLTARDCGLEEKAPMCGVPHHAASQYINKLLEKGYSVAICEQIGDVVPGKLVERDVVKILTPGTICDETALNPAENNFVLSAFYENEENASVVWTDISTGDFFAAVFKDNAKKEIENILVRVKPAELFINKEGLFLNEEFGIIKSGELRNFAHLDGYQGYLELGLNRTLTKEEEFKLETQIVKEYFTKKIEETSLIKTIARIIYFLNRTQKTKLKNITDIKIIDTKRYLKLDANTVKNLEIFSNQRDNTKRGSLLKVLDNTKTAMGGREFKKWLTYPLTEIKEIEQRLDAVEEFKKSTLLSQKLQEELSEIRDIERLSGKLATNVFTPRDAISLRESLVRLPKVIDLLKNCSSALIKNQIKKCNNFDDVAELIQSAIIENPPINLKDGGYINPDFNKDLAELINISKNGKQLIAQMENFERESTGIKTLKIGFNNIFGYYIEVKDKEKNQVPYTYNRRQTIAGGERYVTEELKALETKILKASEAQLKLEQLIFNEIKDKLSGFVSEFKSAAEAVGIIDALLGLSIVANRNSYVRPKLNTEGILTIKNGRHPVIESILKAGEFTPNDTNLNTKHQAGIRTMLITGPNMSGKSTYMRQVALIVFMAQVGSFVPAEHADINITDKIFTRIGASDDLAFGHSTFMVEMVEVANILENATDNSLIILDEVGRGTSTYDGLSIAYAVMDYITKNFRAKTLFASHYHELTEQEGKMEGLKNFNISVKEFEGKIIFLHKIKEGAIGKSYGIEVARLAGLPKELLVNAKNFLEEIEKHGKN
ncbi:MAG: DNA mismatch repair protein MutS [Firmicutes bacterium]|nr:DNA mismatch repair protein MutS [Bacillota bacterium]